MSVIETVSSSADSICMHTAINTSKHLQQEKAESPAQQGSLVVLNNRSWNATEG